MTPSELRLALAELGWSQATLARRIKYNPNTVTRWFKGSAPIPGWLEAHLDMAREVKRLYDTHVNPNFS